MMYKTTLTKLTSTHTHQNLKEIITQLAVITVAKKAGTIKPDTPLLTSQTGFDSFSLMEFVFRLEESFDLQIPDTDLDPDIFYSVNTVAAYIRTRWQKE